MKNLKKYVIYLVLLIIAAGVVGWFSLKDKNVFNAVSITSFQECVDAGYPIQESYPERCMTPDGKSFTNSTSIAPNSEIEVKGEIVCLPKKGEGPHTMECAFGLQSIDGKYYGILNSENPLLTKTGEVLVVKGTFEQADPETSYDIVGNINVTEVLE